MKRVVEIFQVDAFTTQPFGGNPAGVALDAEGLTDEQMQKIAAEMNVAETAFATPTTRPGTNLRLRWFTPSGKEITFCAAGAGAGIFFAPHYGIPEDPVTGSVHASLAMWLWQAGLLTVNGDVATFQAEQGDFLGRPGRLGVELHVVDGQPARVRVGGQAVTVISGSIRVE